LEPIFGKINIILLFLKKISLMFKKLFSYIIPINVFQQKSNISQTLEVTWTDGQLVLDSKTPTIRTEACNGF